MTVPVQTRGMLDQGIPNLALQRVLAQAGALMGQYGHPVMTAGMLGYALLRTETPATAGLRHLASGLHLRWEYLVSQVEPYALNWSAAEAGFDVITETGERLSLSEEVLTLIDEGYTLAGQSGRSQCSPADIISVLLVSQWPVARHLHQLGITSAGWQRVSAEIASQPSAAAGSPVGEQSGSDIVDYTTLTLPPLYVRARLLGELTNLLEIAPCRPILLIGPVGVGKRSLGYGLARQISEGQGPRELKRVIGVRETALLTNPAGVLKLAVEQAGEAGVLFLPNLDRYFGQPALELVAGALERLFVTPTLKLVATIEAARLEELSSLVQRGSYAIQVGATDESETTAILAVQRPALETAYGLTIPPETCRVAQSLGRRYLPEAVMPEGAIHLTHRAAALARQGGAETATPDHLRQVLASITHIPLAILGAGERERLAQMPQHLHRRIVGQGAAVQAVSQAVARAQVGLRDPERPMGAFMFLGSTGVGKTALAKALAEFLFGTERALITLDMSEYMNESAVNRLIGSPPGYIGSEQGGQLTDAVKRQPYSVVLFDEVEKGAPRVFDLLLQVMDEGRLTSSQGEVVSFSETLILLTSNIGSQHLADPALDEVSARQLAETDLKGHFRPEFLNRLDEVIYFHRLDAGHLAAILDLLLAQEEALLAERGLGLQISSQAKRWLLVQNQTTEWGARPLRRLIDAHLRNPLAQAMLAQPLAPGTLVKVGLDGKAGVLKLSFAKPSG